MAGTIRSAPRAAGRRLRLVSVAATGTLLALFLFTLVALPLGWTPSVVVSGSMSPQIRTGDVVLLEPLADRPIREGDVIQFRSPEYHNELVLHRVVGVAPDGRIHTRGDANPQEDLTALDRSGVTSIAKVRVPVIGLPQVVLGAAGSAIAALLLTVVGLSCAGYLVVMWRRTPGADEDPRPAPAVPDVGPRVAGRWAASKRVLAAATVGLLAGVALVGGSTRAAFNGDAVTIDPWTTSITVIDDGRTRTSPGVIRFGVDGKTPSDTPISKCARVSYSGPGAAGPLRLYGFGLTGAGFAGYLDVTVELLQPGRHRSCSGYTGTAIYRGTLAHLAANHRDSRTGLSTTWTPRQAAAAVFRLTYSRRPGAEVTVPGCGLVLVWTTSSPPS
jgi:signal peptidase I